MIISTPGLYRLTEARAFRGTISIETWNIGKLFEVTQVSPDPAGPRTQRRGKANEPATSPVTTFYAQCCDSGGDASCDYHIVVSCLAKLKPKFEAEWVP